MGSISFIIQRISMKLGRYIGIGILVYYSCRSTLLANRYMFKRSQLSELLGIKNEKNHFAPKIQMHITNV